MAARTIGDDTFQQVIVTAATGDDTRQSLPSSATAAAIGAADDTWVDQGAVIDCRGCAAVGLFVALTVNDSTGNQVQVLAGPTAATCDYRQEASASYQKTLGNANTDICYVFETNNVMPYLRIRTKAAAVGATAGVVSLRVVRGWV